MRAAVVRSFDQGPRYEAFELPEPGDGEVVIDVLASGLSPRTRAGASGAHYASGTALPLIPGIDGVGRLASGQRVYFLAAHDTYGAMAERSIADPRKTVLLPDGASASAIAAGMLPAMSSWVVLAARAPMQSGQSVLVLGATGTSGRLAVQIAKHLGAADVIAVGRDASALARARELGANRVVQLTGGEADRDAVAAAASEVDIVLDYLWGGVTSAVMPALCRARRDESRALRWVLIGSAAGDDIALSSVLLRKRNLQILGSGQGATTVAEMLAVAPAIADAFASDRVHVQLREVPLADVATEWPHRAGSHGRVVFSRDHRVSLPDRHARAPPPPRTVRIVLGHAGTRAAHVSRMSMWGAALALGVVTAMTVTVTACGAPGDGGPQTLGRISVDPGDTGDTGDAHCTLVETGVDTDASGDLGDDEVTITEQLCPPETTPACPSGKSIAGPLIVDDEDSAAALAGVACVEGDLFIIGVPDAALPNVDSLVAVTGNLAIAGDPNITSLDTLANLRVVGGTILVQGNDWLGDLNGIGTVVRPPEIRIIANPHLPDLEGLEPLGNCGTSLVIAGNPELASLTGLDSISKLDDVTIRANPQLATLDALDHLQSASSIVIDDEPALSAITLPALTSVAGDLEITGVPIRTFAPPMLGTVGTVWLANDSELLSIELPALVDTASIQVDHDRKLATIAAPGAPALTSLEVDSAPSLAELEFPRVETITGVLDIENAAIRDLVGLGAVTKVGGDLVLAHDPLLPAPIAKAFAAQVEVAGKTTLDL